MPGDQSIHGIPDGCGDETGNLCEPPDPAEVSRHTQRSSRMRKDAFRIRAVGWFDKQHGVEPSNFRMPREDIAARRAVERRKPKRSAGITREHELNALGAEATGAVVQEDG